MKNWFDSLIANFQLDPWMMTLAMGLWLIVVAAAVLVFMATFAGITSWLERRIAGRMQSRIGPNRVGPLGFLQWLADGLKSFLKEDVIPDAADKPLFKLAPYLVFPGGFAAFAALPWGYGIIASNIDIGIFYITAITTLVVIGILMAGWSSNNKWSLIGGVRAAAQMISYEIPAGLAVLAVVAIAGTLNMQEIVAQQGGWPWQWFFFSNPFTFIAFFIFFASILAEGNRTPFDLPEAESELVAGYLTEYSGMRFLFFLFTEWANVWTMSALITTLFLGGWQIPGIADLGEHHRRGIRRGQDPLGGGQHRRLFRQDQRLRLYRHLAALDPAAPARRSIDDHVLEIFRPHRLCLPDRLRAFRCDAGHRHLAVDLARRCVCS